MNEMPDSSMERIKHLFCKELELLGRRGLVSAAKFSDVYDTLMPVQREALREICGESFDDLCNLGSVVCMAIAYNVEHIQSIYQKSDDKIDVELWNEYARAYEALNRELNSTAEKIADEYQGIAIPATFTKKRNGLVEHVEAYFGRAVSHRAIAELAGIGWRGKNGLIVNRDLGCAIRFASIVVPFELEYGQQESLSCGDCTACEDICSFIRNRNLLSDYREYCRRYINYLRRIGVSNDICGKCIKACLLGGIYASQFELNGEDRGE